MRVDSPGISRVHQTSDSPRCQNDGVRGRIIVSHNEDERRGKGNSMFCGGCMAVSAAMNMGEGLGKCREGLGAEQA